MTDTPPREGSLVLYKGRPARVARVGDKLEIELGAGETQKVRPKDVVLLHPGPLRSLADLKPVDGETEAAWELLAGTSTTLPELAELAFGTYTPASAWAAWQLVADGLYFRGTLDAIQAADAAEVSQRQAARQAEAEEKRAWQAFTARLAAGHYAPEDARYLREVEDLALRRAARARALHALGREESPENAHALLLELGYWDATRDPYPERLGLDLTAPDLSVPDLPAEERRDLTHLPAFAIDDASSDVPDDALSLEGSRLWVHVADPAALIAPDSPLDLEARARGSTLYLPEGVVPMLPPAATPCLGLGLNEISPALSFGLDMTADGQIAGVEIVPSWVRVTRLTYEAAEAHLGEQPLAGLSALAQAYRCRRRAAGAICIDFPEVNIRVKDGIVELRPVPLLRSRSLVEEAMIAAGEAAARFALEHNIPLPFATHDAPEEAPGNPTTLAAMFAVRRTLKRGQYRAAPAPHAGLGLPAYTQVTSPMRRYLDLVAHQQLRAFLQSVPMLDVSQIVERVGAIEAVIGLVRQTELLAEKHWTLVYLMQHPGWRGAGIVVDRRGQSGIALIPELALETTLHLPNDPSLDSSITLTCQKVDLPRLDVYFRVM